MLGYTYKTPHNCGCTKLKLHQPAYTRLMAVPFKAGPAN